jgi:hypothetical protein
MKSTNGAIINNNFYNIDGTVVLLEGTDHMIVQGNIFRDVGIGIDNTYNAIELQLEGATENTNCIIKDNMCYSDHANKPYAFINFSSGLGTDCVIENNIGGEQGVDFTYGQIGSEVPYNTFRNNVGYPEDGMLRYEIHGLDADTVKSLATTPYTLVEGQGSQTLIEFVAASMELQYTGTGNWAEPSSPDNLVIRLGGVGAVEVTNEITANGFITATNDETRLIKPKNIDNIQVRTEVSLPLLLANTGEDYTDTGGTPESVLWINVIYRVFNHHG